MNNEDARNLREAATVTPKNRFVTTFPIWFLTSANGMSEVIRKEKAPTASTTVLAMLPNGSPTHKTKPTPINPNALHAAALGEPSALKCNVHTALFFERVAIVIV